MPKLFTVTVCLFVCFQELCALENVIGNLLEGCHVTQARWLANLFSHSSLELDVVMVTCVLYTATTLRCRIYALIL